MTKKQKTSEFNWLQLSYKEALFTLRASYQIILDILNTIGSLDFCYSNNLINKSYIIHSNIVSEILKLKEFAKLKKEAPALFDGLMSNLSDIMDFWDDMKEKYYRFFDLIEKECILENVEEIQIPKDLQEYWDGIKKILTFYKRHCLYLEKQQFEETDKEREEIKKSKHLLYKNSKGDYVYNSQVIDVPTSTEYYKVFDTICSGDDQDGFISYEDIEKGLVSRSMLQAEDNKTRNKRVNNAISNHQGFFRYAKIKNKPLKNRTLDGKKLIKIIRGKGVKLNNPQIA